MRSAIVCLSMLALAGCAYPLGTVHPEQGQTVRERDQDMLYCKDSASTGANSAGAVVGSFLAGLTIIGGPVAISMVRDKERELFANCMAERGYRVEAPKQ